MSTVTAAVDAAFAVGMHQHRDEILAFAEWLADRRPHHVIEIGGLHGGTATLWAAIATGRVISVDLPGGRFGGADHGYDHARCLARNARLSAAWPGRYVGILGDSHAVETLIEVANALELEPADLLFIDGDHALEGVTRDLALYRELVRPGGVIAFHDVEDTPLHRAAGCLVSDLWRSLDGQKREFTIHGEWGGIGVVMA